LHCANFIADLGQSSQEFLGNIAVPFFKDTLETNGRLR
jgi:hypothetical protein